MFVDCFTRILVYKIDKFNYLLPVSSSELSIFTLYVSLADGVMSLDKFIYRLEELS